MPVITSGLYTVKLFQTYQNQQCLNVFWYRASTGSDVQASDLRTVFENNVMPDIAAIHPTALVYDDLLVQPVFGLGIEAGGQPLDPNGNRTPSDELLPPHFASSIRLFRSTSEVRNGWKRFTGLDEGLITPDGLDPGFVALMTVLANQLQATIGVTTNYIPVLVRKPGTYKEGELTDYVYTDILSASVIQRVTTQNSRKPWG
jgi:hypothetical protein